MSFVCTLTYGCLFIVITCYGIAVKNAHDQNSSTSQSPFSSQPSSSASAGRHVQLTTSPYVQPSAAPPIQPSAPPSTEASVPSNSNVTTRKEPHDVSQSSNAPPSYESTLMDPPSYETTLTNNSNDK